MGSLTLPSKGADFEPVPAGAHVAVCYQVIDLGTQETNFKGHIKLKHQIMIRWEIPEEKMRDGRPFTIGRRYTYSSHKKAGLRIDLESWRGKPFEDLDFGTFDIGKLIGVGCMLNVIHEQGTDGTTYANIKSIMRLPKGTKAPELYNDPLCFSLFEDYFDENDFDKLSDRMQEIIAQSPEYRKLMGEDVEDEQSVATSSEIIDDEIPF